MYVVHGEELLSISHYLTYYRSAICNRHMVLFIYLYSCNIYVPVEERIFISRYLTYCRSAICNIHMGLFLSLLYGSNICCSWWRVAEHFSSYPSLLTIQIWREFSSALSFFQNLRSYRMHSTLSYSDTTYCYYDAILISISLSGLYEQKQYIFHTSKCFILTA